MRTVTWIAVLLLLAPFARARAAPQNCHPTLVLHAEPIGGGGTCSVEPCPAAPSDLQLEAGVLTRVYLVLRNHDNVAGVQTEFAWPADWQLLGQSWSCQGFQVTWEMPDESGGTIQTAFNCVDGPEPAVIGWMLILPGSAGCLEQVESTFPFGTHVVNCTPGAPACAPVAPENRGSLCIGMPGDDACEPDLQWIDASTGALAGTNGTGVAWGDFDTDGDDDLYLVKQFAANVLLENRAGAFVDVTTPALADAAQGRGAAWGDFDTDGDLDLYLANQSAANRLFRNDAGTFTDVTPDLLADPDSGQSVAWVDANRDGALDLCLVNAGSPSRLFWNDGAGGFLDSGSDIGGGGFGVAWGDFDDDGDPDVHVSQRLYRNDDGTFVDVTASTPLPVFAVVGSLWGDFDGDADLDLYVARDGDNVLVRNDGGGSFTDVTAPPLDAPGPSRGLGAADFDNDGDLDLYVGSHNERNQLLRNDGALAFARIANVCLEAVDFCVSGEGTTQGLAWSDVNGDGTMDLYVAQFLQEAPGALLENYTGSAHAWLEVELQGVRSNLHGIGARIVVEASIDGGDAVAQIREVHAGSGYLSQASAVAHFGLGAASIVDRLEVRWPSGYTQVLTHVAVGQRLAVIESSRLSISETATSPPAVPRLVVQPNPFHPATTIRYRLSQPADVHARIVAPSGRLVRELHRGRESAGEHLLIWDGRTDAGRPAASGVYLLHWTSGRTVLERKLVLAR